MENVKKLKIAINMHEFSESPLLFAFDSVAPNTSDKWVENYVHKDKWIFAVTLLGIPISQIWTSLSGSRHCETAQCPLKKHRQKPKVLSVTPMACHPFQQIFLSLVLLVWSSTASTHVPNKDTLVSNPLILWFQQKCPSFLFKHPTS